MADIAVTSLTNQLSTLLSQGGAILGEFQPDVQFIKDELGSMQAFLRDAEAKEDTAPELKEWVKQEPKTPAAQSQSGSKTLFVGNLSFSVERADVEAFFKDCGEVVDVRFATHPDGAFKGFGHVEFATAEAAQEIREVSFDAEDVLDDLSFLFARNHGDGFCGRVQKIYSSIKNLRTRHRISSEIKNIKARVENISARHQRYQSIYGIQERTIARNTDYDIRATSLLIEEARLVGIDNPKRALISQILDDNPRLKVISVVGMGGLGKTTLVRKVYDNAAVKKQFQSHSWLTVSQTFQVLVSVKDLIQQLFVEIGKPVPLEVNECTDIVRLSAFVKAFLQDRRYIVVLDDVWSTNSWDAIKYLLPDCNSGSRVILTTRRVDVASASCLESHYHVHRMEPLSDKDSWTLFCNRAFQSSHCPLYLEDVSKRIIKKCEGLPLGIVAICGVLALKDKDKIGDWKMILHSLGGELEEGSGKLDQIRKILLLSYNDLTHHLKSCLLSFCVFSEDNEIYLDQLIWKWIAHGFVQENNGISAVDIGRRYAKELISRSLLQVTRTTTCGTSEFVRVHDFLREIIAQKSREQNFGALATGYFPRGSEKVRLLAIYDFVDNEGSQELNDCLKSVRSLEFFGERSRLSAPVLSKFLRGCSKKLKVLDLRAAALEDIPGEVFKLFHLKYLCLRDTEVRTIPKSIGKLQNLDFLDFSGTKVAELPVEILMLRKLRSLEGGSVVGNYSGNFIVRGIKFPRGIGKLLSLESLRTIEADDKEIVREIRKLKKLRNLEISKLKRDDGKELLSSLEKLTNLENLGVVSINEEEPIDLEYSVSPTPSSLETIALVGHLGSVPKWVISLDSLTSLWLMNSGLKEDDVTGIEAIQVLPNLAYLDLNHAYGGETLSVKAGGFQKLKELRLVKLERLRWVRLEKDSMPSLEKLIIAGCKLMEGLPFGIENLTNLNCLQLLDMSDGLAEKMKNLDKRSDEYQKIAHIPEVVIGYWKNGEWERSLL